MSTTSLSVIVPVRDGGPLFERCLEALSKIVQPPDELIIILDGADEEACEAASRVANAREAVRQLQHETSRGPAAARNTGARSAEGDVLFFVDADVAVPTDTVERARRHFDAHPDMDALIGSYDDAPADPHLVAQYRNLLHHYTHQVAREEAQTFWGACGAVRRETFWAVGGFDAEWHRLEDVELGYRLRAHGARIRLLKSLQVKHLKRWRLYSMIRTDVWVRAAAWTELLLLRNRSLPNDLNTDIKSRLSVAATGIGVGALLFAPWRPAVSCTAAAAAFGSVFALGGDFFSFLVRVRSRRFALKAFPLHLVHYLCAGSGLILGASRHLARRVAHHVPSFTSLEESLNP